MVNSISNFNFSSQKTIPTIYDDSLSYYEVLGKVVMHLNEMGETTNEVIEQYKDMEQFVDKELEGRVKVILEDWKSTGDFDKLLTAFVDLYTEEMSKKVNESSYIDGIKVDSFVYRGNGGRTTVHLTTIPLKDETGEKVVLKRGFAKDKMNSGELETARDFASRHKASAVFNASVFHNGTGGTNKLLGNQVYDGKVITGDTVDPKPYRWYLGIKADGTLKSYPNGTSNSQMIGEGCKHVLTGFYPIVMNGSKPPASAWNHPGGADIPYIRQVIAQRESGQYVFLTSEGYQDYEVEYGLNMEDCYNILVEKFPTDKIMNAYYLDGGGSAQSVIYGTMINHPKDEDGTKERLVPDFLYFSKPEVLTPRDNDIFNAYRMIGNVKNELSSVKADAYTNNSNHYGYYQLIKDDPSYNSFGIETWIKEAGKSTKERISKLELAKGRLRYIDVSNSNKIVLEAGPDGIKGSRGAVDIFTEYATLSTNLNTALKSGNYWVTTGEGKNSPDPALSWSVDVRMLNTTAGLQTATAFSSPYVTKTRRYNNGAWSSWE